MTTLAGPPLSDVGPLTIGEFALDVCTRFGPNEALVFDDPLQGGATVRWSYTDLLSSARGIARALVACGVGRGTRVGILMGNRPEAAAAVLGVPMAGAVAVLLSTFSPLPELEFLLRDADISVLLTQDRLLDRSFGTEVATLEDLPFLSAAFSVGTPSWASFIERASSVHEAVIDGRVAATHPSDHAVIIYSSGTTDRPKGMIHTHRAPVLQFWQQAALFGRGQATRMWCPLPIFWTAGLNTALGATLAAGGCFVMQEVFDAGAAIGLMERERVTEPYCLPHQTAALAEHPAWAGADFSAMTCVFGKSAFARHPSVHGDTRWNMPVGFGLSETCAFFIAHGWDTPKQLMKESMGRLLPGNELRVVDPTTETALGAGEDGELVLRGPTMMDRYVHKLREECFDRDGFFHTGDMGFFDTDGYVHWTGRATEMIKTGGANVSPAEIEVQLRACAPVKLARVVGVPDPRLDQMVVLAVTLRDGVSATEAEIQAFLRERVAAYKVPKRVLFFDDGQIPMTSSSTKVRDTELMALVMAALGDD